MVHCPVVSSIDQLTTGQWTIYETDLAQFAGQNVRIGVHYTSFDAFFAQLDDFYVGNGEDEGSTIDVGSVLRYEVYIDGHLHGTTTEPAYTVTHLAAGTHRAGIRAVYTSGASAMVECEFTVTTAADPCDVNGDGHVDIDDVNAIINVILDLTTDPALKAGADVNGDGRTDIDDVNMLVNRLLAN